MTFIKPELKQEVKQIVASAEKVPDSPTWRGRQWSYRELIDIAGMGNVPRELEEACREAVAYLKLMEGV